MFIWLKQLFCKHEFHKECFLAPDLNWYEYSKICHYRCKMCRFYRPKVCIKCGYIDTKDVEV